MTTIGLIEDNYTIRDVYTKYFGATRSFEVLFAVGDIADALDLNIIQPKIILLDVNLPSGSGIDGIKLLKTNFPGSRIVMLSSVLDNDTTKQAISNGATGYLLKSSSMAYISESLLEIDTGGRPFSPATITHILQPQRSVKQKETTGLTNREFELIDLLSDGHSNKVAAAKLDVTYFTVNQHLKNIYKKLNINSKSELISWFLNRKN